MRSMPMRKQGCERGDKTKLVRFETAGATTVAKVRSS